MVSDVSVVSSSHVAPSSIFATVSAFIAVALLACLVPAFRSGIRQPCSGEVSVPAELNSFVGVRA